MNRPIRLQKYNEDSFVCLSRPCTQTQHDERFELKKRKLSPKTKTKTKQKSKISPFDHKIPFITITSISLKSQPKRHK